MRYYSFEDNVEALQALSAHVSGQYPANSWVYIHAICAISAWANDGYYSISKMGRK